MSNITKHIAVIACLLPLLFFNIKNTHDWGDDFSQYLLEAKNILNHQPLDKTNFTQNLNYVLGPNCYPPVFPLIIAGTSFITHFEMDRLNILISFFLLLIGYFSFVLFHKWFSFLPSLLLSLIIVYNPLCLNLKTEVLSDFPFTAIILLFFILYLEVGKKTWHYVLLGLIIALAVNIRFVGWILFFTLIADIIFKLGIKYYKRKEFDKTHFKNSLIIIFAFAGFHLLFYLIFPVKIIYYDNPHALPMAERISLNANYNYAILKYFFSCFDEGFLNYIISYGFVFSALLGMILFIVKPDPRKPSVFLFFFFGYLASVLIHQYSDTGLRLVIPLIPLVLFFWGYAFFIVFNKLPYKNYFASGICVLVLFCYRDNSLKVLRSANDVAGPYTAEASLAFDYINKNTNENSSILFCKPRALTLFTNRKTYMNTERANVSLMESELKNYDPNYVLICNEITDDSTKTYFFRTKPHWEVVYKSENYKLYKNSLNSQH